MTAELSDAAFMRRAIELSKLGFPAPNPRVGAVIVLDGQIVGEGHHEAAGGDHAEASAIKAAGGSTRGASLYVTLEPCSHTGKTPPCVDAILDAGIARVVYGVSDPNPIAAGGDHKLRAAGVDVQGGLLADEASAENHVFVESHRLGRPFIVVKAGTTLDGKIATESGESKWITGSASRARAHWLRAEMGCVLIGANTAIHDNPRLTARDVGASNQPLRVVLDPRGRVPADSELFVGKGSAMRVTSEAADSGVDEFIAPTRGSLFALDAILQELARRGVRGVLVEGGGRTIGSFFEQGCVDEVELHIAPTALGSGKSWVQSEVAGLADAYRLEVLRTDRLGEDIMVRARVIR
jgi:diaminohydroxyphosphoribosylaminopyrimidine deaminase/5-amino-6-(5-phosphoribosylamino)uracil reductase